MKSKKYIIFILIAISILPINFISIFKENNIVNAEESFLVKYQKCEYGNLDNGMAVYSNSKLGFYMNSYPIYVKTLNKCPVGVQLAVSNYSKMTKVGSFENVKNGVLYISQGFYYDIKADTGECDRITYNLEILREEEAKTSPIVRATKPIAGWKIIIDKPENDNDINDFLQNNFGLSCRMDSKKNQDNGIYSISLKGDGCATGFNYKILYSKEINKMISFNLGNGCTFFGENQKCLDDIMINNFEF